MEFDRVWKIKKDLSMDQMRMEELKSKAYGIGARDLSGMPKSSGFSVDGGKTAQYAVEIVNLEKNILDRKLELTQEMIRIARFIETISDSKLRMIFTMRCIETKSWKEIYKTLQAPMKVDESIDSFKKLYQRACKKYGESDRENIKVK